MNKRARTEHTDKQDGWQASITYLHEECVRIGHDRIVVVQIRAPAPETAIVSDRDDRDGALKCLYY